MSSYDYVLVYPTWDRPPLKYFSTNIKTLNGGLLEIWDEDGCLAEFNKNGWVHIDYVRAP